MKIQFLLSFLLLVATHTTVQAQYNYYNSSQYRYNNAVHNYNIGVIQDYYNQRNSNMYNSYNYNSYSPSYNYNSYSPSYNSYSEPSNSYYGYYTKSNYDKSKKTTSDYIDSKIIFCENIDANWNPVGIYSSFTITPETGWVKIYLENQPALYTTAITAKVYLQQFGVYSLVDEHTYTLGAEAKNHVKAGFGYNFSKNGAGSYRLDFYSKEGVFINSGYVTIISKKTENSDKKTETQKSVNNNNPIGGIVTNSEYYKNSNIYFFESGLDFDKAGTGRKFLYQNFSRDTAYIEVNNGEQAMKTSKLNIGISKKTSAGDYQNYDAISFNYNEPSSNMYYFTYRFKEAGDYRFDVKNAEGVWINAAYVTVYKK